MNKTQCIIKFVFDRLASLLGLLVLSPVFLILMVLVKISVPKESPFFSQVRVGHRGKPFKMHKFRTMVDVPSGPQIAYPNRMHVTPLGSKLRKYKLDELPELWDVLIGKMSLVGPRPDVPGYADRLEGEDRVVLEMRPGITGPATLKYRNEEKMMEEYVHEAKSKGDPRSEMEIALWYNDCVIYPDKVRINKEYYWHYSFFLDLKIIVQTVC